MSKVRLVCGPVGAGKTRFAKKFSQDEGAVHFSIDEWMTTLFTPDLTGEIEYAWAMERIGRMESLVWSHVRQLMALDVDAVLDLGLLQRSHREKFYALARQDAFDICLHLVDADRDARWRRVQDRNHEKGGTYSMEVNRGMFDFCEGLFEKPTGAELDLTVIHRS